MQGLDRAMRYALERAPFVVAEADEEAVRAISANVEPLLGYRAEEIVGVPGWWERHTHPEDLEATHRVLREARERGDRELRTLFRIRHRDGEYRWWDSTARFEPTPDGSERILIHASDVTERRRAEESSQEAQARYRGIVENAIEGIFRTSLDGTFVFANPALARMVGYETVEEFLEAVPNASALYGDPAMREEFLRLLREHGSVTDFEIRGSQAVGEDRWASLNARLVRDASGSPAGIEGTLVDITARKRAEAALRDAEARYRTLVEQLPAVTYVTASHEDRPGDGRWLYLSPQLESMLGYRPEEWTDWMDGWREAIHEEDRERVLAEDVLTDETLERYSVEYRIRTRDGRMLWVHDVAEPLHQRDGVQLWHGLMFDVTPLKIAEEELRQSMRLLRSAAEERQRLLSRLTEVQEDERRRIAADIHDDPIQKMTAAGLRAESLRRRLSDPSQVEALDQLQSTISKAIARMRRLLFELRPASLDREGLAAALRQYVAELDEEGGLEVAVEDRMVLEPPVDTRIVAYRIAQEALSNARKHAGPCRVTVLLETRGEDLFMRLRDEGAGFDPSRDDRQPGHLGLSTMRERAELAGGSVHIDSAPGRGTTVEARLPTRVGRTVG